MLRLLCVAGAALALTVGGTGVAFAAVPVPAASSACDIAKDATAKAQSNLNRAVTRNGNEPNADNRKLVEDLTNDLKTAQRNENNACGNPGGVYVNCAEYNAHGIFDIRRNDPRYKDVLDRDNDGVACERVEGGGPVGLPGNWHDRFDGRYIVLDRGPRLDVCSDDNYDRFVSRNTTYRDRLGHLFGANPQARYVQLRAMCGQSNTRTTVIDNGDCKTLVTTQTREYNDYVATVRRWNDASSHYSAARRTELDQLLRDRDRLRHDFDNTRTKRLTVCKDTGGETVNNITVNVPPVDYTPPATTTLPAPPPPPDSGGQVSQVPSGAAETGDGTYAETQHFNLAVGVAGAALFAVGVPALVLYVRSL